MAERLSRDGCVYQDDAVGLLADSGNDDLLRENDDGNVVLGTDVLKEFRALTPDAVWVKSDFYWRFRVREDEPGRDARG